MAEIKNLKAEMAALKERKAIQDLNDAAYQMQARKREVLCRLEEKESGSHAAAARDPLEIPPTLTSEMQVSLDNGKWKFMHIELRGPFLFWGSNMGDLSQASRMSMVGAIVSSNNDILCIDAGGRLIQLHPDVNTGGAWLEALLKAARQDARRSGLAVESPTSSSSPRPEGGSSSSTCTSMADFEMLELVGKGSYGEVWRARVKSTGRLVALKVLEGAALQQRTREQTLLMTVKCPFVISAEAAFNDGNSLCIVMPLLEGGDLFLHLDESPEGCFNIDRARYHAAEIVLALEYLHSKGIVYRDLKPENVVLDAEGHIVLTDMGHARSLSTASRAETFCGTTEYLAPEVCKTEGHTHAVDLWALGVLLFEMLTGQLPFDGENQVDICENIMLAEPQFPPTIDPDAQNLISQLLRKDPQSRPSAADLRKHPFFASINWDRLARRELPPPFVPDLENIRRMVRRSLRRQ
eukprot:Sspe_Gene.77220::Locus_48238_Transcript_1_1_Confidence_1.000_Length_1655::g.77220::m.77220/K04456/AKT; RAC serine/threonine-protein kinase